jgi:hypothetical protein
LHDEIRSASQYEDAYPIVSKFYHQTSHLVIFHRIVRNIWEKEKYCGIYNCIEELGMIRDEVSTWKFILKNCQIFKIMHHEFGYQL